MNCTTAVLADRAAFLPDDLKPLADSDEGLVVADGIHVPSAAVTRLMLELLELKPADVVLEIGTGSGYQTACLALQCAEVYSVDIRPVQDGLQNRLPPNCYLYRRDGRNGLETVQAFDAILVTCGTPKLYPRWAQQLREGGRLVVPYGAADGQELRKYVRRSAGLEDCGPYAYVRFLMMEEAGR